MPGSHLTRLSSLTVDLLLSRACLGCGAPGTSLCPRCALPLREEPEAVAVGSRHPDLPAVWAAARYEGAVRAALIAHKERGALELTATLGTALAAAVRAALAGSGPTAGATTGGPPGGDPVILVPVPSRRAAVRSRGDDTVARLARRAARELAVSGVPARCLPMLGHRREVADSRDLGAAERLANVSGAMAVRRRVGRAWPVPVHGGAVVVVDDLVTTGASLGEAVRALRVAGVPVRSAAVVARR